MLFFFFFFGHFTLKYLLDKYEDTTSQTQLNVS